MAHDLKYHVRRAIDFLYEFLFNGPAYDPATQAGSCCIKPYHGEHGAANPGSFAGSVTNNGGRAGRLASAAQDKVGSVASSASSAVASLVSTIGSSGDSGSEENVGSHTIGRHHQHHGGSTGGWHSTSTDSTFSHWQSVLLNYWHSLSIPDFRHQLQPRVIIDNWARSWNLEPNIFIFIVIIIIILLFLFFTLMRGAGNTSEEPHAPGRKSDPKKVGEKGSQGSSASYASKVASGSSSTSNAGKGKKIQGSKKGVAQDDVGSIASQSQLGNDNSISSWSALLGSTGFMGGESLGYKPIDIYAAMKSAEKIIVDSAEDAFAPGHDGGIVSNIIEEIVGSTETQHEQKEIGLDNKEEYIDNVLTSDQHNVNQVDKGRASRSGPAGPGGSASNSSPAKIRVPRPYGVKEADRHRHQPHMSFRKVAAKSAPHQAPQSSFAAKVMYFAQEDPVMKNLDGISGGVLGAAMATVAALSNTVQAATTSLKESMPTSVDEFTHDLRSSFDKAIEEGGLEGTGFDKQDEQSYVTPGSIRAKDHKAESSRASSSSPSKPTMENFEEIFSKGSPMVATSQCHSSSSAQSVKDNFGEIFSKGPAMITNPPRLHKRSVVHAQPGTAANISAATVAAAATAHIPASAATSSPSSSGSTHKAAASASSVKSASHTSSNKSTPASYKAALSSNSAKATSTSKPAKAAVTIEDISPRPATHSEIQKSDSPTPAKMNDVKIAATEAAHGAKKAAADALNDAKEIATYTVDVVRDSVQEAKGTSRNFAHKAKGAANDAVKGAKGAVDNAADKASKLKHGGVKTAHEAVEQVKDDIDKNTLQPTKNAERKVKGAVKDAEKKAEIAVNNVSKTAKEAKGAAVQKASGAAKETKDVVGTVAKEANELKDATIEKASDAVERAKDVIDRNVVQPLKDAEKKVEGSVKNAEKRVEDAVESAYKAKEAFVQKAGEVAQVAADAVKDAEKRAEDAVKSASETSHKAKDTGVERTEEIAHATVDTVKGAEKRAENAIKSAAEVAKEAKDAAIRKAGEMAHTAAEAVKDAERQLEEAVTGEPYAEDSFDDGSLIDADEDQSLDEMDEDTPSHSVHFDRAARKTNAAAAVTATAQPPVAASSAHIRSPSPSEMAQNVMDEAADELADVAESLSSMFAGFKDSVARALKDVKDLASHVGPALAPASTSVSTAHATGHLETSPTSSSSNMFKQQAGSKRKSVEAHADHPHAAHAHTAAVPSPDAPQHKNDNKKPDGHLDGRSYSDVVKVTPTTTPKLAAAKLSGGFPTAPPSAADDNSVHPHDDGPAPPSSDDHADKPPTKVQEFTVDQSGNKVPVVDARRDSGFDLLM